jgi:hypothetical protein
VWQGLFGGLKDHRFMVVAVAEDSRGAEHARPWIEQAKAEYWCLIDPDHRVASLYGMANVPRAVWIDELGRIVRPPENAGSTDHFRNMDQTALTLSPADQAARDAGKAFYVNAVKEWVMTGRHVLEDRAVWEKLPRMTDDIAVAHAHFRLGVWLRRHGAMDEAGRHLAEASRLHPESWNMWRQAADLDAVGNAAGPRFWARVQALGNQAYHQPPDLPGFPT